MHGEKVVSHLVINGFTINPVKDISYLHILINSLCTLYENKHECDLGSGIVHENFLGKQIGQPSVSYIENTTFKGLIGFAVLENGYFVIKIWDGIHPAEVQFDLYLDTKLPDCDIILDHLSCPVGHYDGLGLFNCTYSINYITKNEPPISKENKKTPTYFKNESFNSEKYNQDPQNYSFILDEFHKVECYFCEENITDLTYIGYPKKIIFVCNNHKKMHYYEKNSFNFNVEKITKIIDNKIITKNIDPTEFDLDKKNNI